MAENPMAHALSCQWPFGESKLDLGESKLDLKQSSLRRVRSSNLTTASWLAELAAPGRGVWLRQHPARDLAGMVELSELGVPKALSDAGSAKRERWAYVVHFFIYFYIGIFFSAAEAKG